MLYKKIFCFLIAYLFYLSYSFAALPQSSGYYLEGNVGSARDLTISAANFNFGYKINDFFAAEIGSAIYSDDSKNDFLFDLALKVIFPFSNGTNLFVKIGEAQAHGGGEFKPVIYYGAGAGYSFTSNITCVAQFNSTTENEGVQSPTQVLLGINYNF